LGVAQRNHALLSEILKVASARYSSVSGTQQDVLRARLDAARTNENANALKEEQRAVVAELNALLDRPSNTALPRAMIPSRINRAAVDTSARNLFVSNDLGSSVSDSPLYPLDSLQVMASRSNPELRVMRAMGEAAST